MIRDCSNKWSNIRIYVEHLSKYPKTIRPQGTIGTCLKGIEQRFPLVLQRGEQSLLLSERQNQVQYLDGVGQECEGWRLERAAGQQKHIQVWSVVNILSLDLQCCRHVTHKVLQERNYEGQTLLAIIEVNRWWRSLVTSLRECLDISLLESTWRSPCRSCWRRSTAVTGGTSSRRSSAWPGSSSPPCHPARLLENSMTWKIQIPCLKGL